MAKIDGNSMVMEDIPISNRDVHEQIAFRPGRNSPSVLLSEKSCIQGCFETIFKFWNKPLDANRYATKKTIAQGMLDIALLTANASQLKYVLQVGEENHPFYYLMISLISISIILQGIVGVLFLIIGGLNINKKTEHKAADRLNNVIILIIFFITLINVVLNGFGIRTTDLKK
ncbi:ninjurin-2 isoform X5 [Lepeophtheirus salmonis]|uniref:Ninjurin-1 n=1 Tax=Lepeophtheirus salmonis TaxID=72036 RepID=D3PH63_LEPSM|nr:ninjurin-2-like isoform X5 [Lepeophtheirus salmonis]ADD37899.1 Ninjurin-1 [Lepeophtheirus salmonis]